MRQARIKIPPAEDEAVYHCISHTVNGEYLFDDVAMEVLRRQMWQVADYCGVQVLTYCFLSNHFHILVRVPKLQAPSDAELLRRYQVLYPKPTAHQAARLEVIRTELTQNGPEAVRWRERQIALMGDVSQYMKLLKQRFSIWFNKAHQRFGTLWSERFKSVLIEPQKGVLRTISAYVDLNAVRAGLIADPKDYRSCGYAQAVAGDSNAQEGIRFVIGGESWADVQAHYREVLFGTGAGPREAATISVAALERVVAEGGKLPLPTVLRCRLRYLTDGAVLGSRGFVEGQLAKYREKTGRRKQIAARALPEFADWGGMMSLRGFRRRSVECT